MIEALKNIGFVVTERLERKELRAQLQISVAYFCSIGLYFLV